MSRLTFLTCMFAGVLTCWSPLRAAEPEPPKGFKAIFNGQDLSGWYGWDPHQSAKLAGDELAANLKQQRAEFPKHWKVEDGELVNSGTGPYATTDEEFGDMELLLEYKTVAGADSGIYLRGCPQVQIWDTNQPHNDNNPTRKPYLGSGGLFNNTPGKLGRDPALLADKKFGAWNTLKIRIIGDRVWVTFNSRAVVDGVVMENYWDRNQPLPARGPIQLQTHGGEIRWRKIFVREIKPAEAKRFLDRFTPTPEPTYYDVSYGPHPKQLIHFWQAESATPTPTLLFIHGGGWQGGGRLSGLTKMLPNLLSQGISVASIEYRFIVDATAEQVSPPVKAPLHDAARALQFIRHQAATWNIDKSRIAASGGSAGACSSLWLAFHPDMAQPDSPDPVQRESTRLLCAAVTGAQTTLDPQQMREWTPNSRYGGHAFGFTGNPEQKLSQFDQFLAQRDSIMPWIEEYSPYALVSADDPPIYMFYAAPPALGQPQDDPTHTSNFGVKLQERCRQEGVICELVYPNAPDVQHKAVEEYLINKLK